MSPTQITFAERAFDALNRFPSWLESFDALEVSGWVVLLVMTIATVGLIFAVREFLSWFLKTNALIDEVLRLENLVRDLQGDLTALEGTVQKLQSSAGNEPTPASATPTLAMRTPETQVSPKPQFPLDH